MVRQENIETASTSTIIIPTSTVIIAQNNHEEPISSELINLDIIKTLQKAKHWANDQEQAITPQEAPKNLIDLVMAEANQLEKEKELKLPQEASVDIYKASHKAYKNALQHKQYQILEYLWKNCINSYLPVKRFLGHLSTFKLLIGWNPLI
ncbi:hypothetical protein O181_054197 [Austropuccinia psidii MF-1]|uniref:Uncharacterized protein n=1 Tax=Austropuccinia psidii MF-1 TaxID=1389203 RepID=A0A9Q3HSA3_9BASI|nr:hypothetical protein [Austropuccinia psidii MF-1]